VDGPLELGRQENSSERLFEPIPRVGSNRVAIASLGEQSVSRRHALIEPLPDGRVKVSNLSAKQTIRLLDGSDLPANGTCTATLPLLLTLGNKKVRIQAAETDDLMLFDLGQSPSPPGTDVSIAASLAVLAGPAVGAAGAEQMVRWLQPVLGV